MTDSKRNPRNWQAIALALLFQVTSAHAETLNNDTVIALARAGLGAETIIAKIKSSPGTYSLDTVDLIKLKQAKVADAVIAAMLDSSSRPSVASNAAGVSDSPDPLAPHATGIYVLNSWVDQHKMQRLDPTTSAQTKDTGRLLSAITYGIAKVKMKTVLPSSNARLRIKSSEPSFYFYFDQNEAKLSQGSTGAFGLGQQTPVTSPNEFALVRFETKAGNREIVMGQANIAGSQSGVMDKSRVAFDYEEIAPGVYKVTPTGTLTPGEYGFVYAASGAGNMASAYGGGGSGVKIFDFGVE